MSKSFIILLLTPLLPRFVFVAVVGRGYIHLIIWHLFKKICRARC